MLYNKNRDNKQSTEGEHFAITNARSPLASLEGQPVSSVAAAFFTRLYQLEKNTVLQNQLFVFFIIVSLCVGDCNCENLVFSLSAV